MGGTSFEYFNTYVKKFYNLVCSTEVQLGKKNVALSGVAQWIERQPVNWKVTGLILGQDSGLGCGPGPQMGMCERQLINVSLPLLLFLPPLPSF